MSPGPRRFRGLAAGRGIAGKRGDRSLERRPSLKVISCGSKMIPRVTENWRQRAVQLNMWRRFIAFGALHT